MHISLEKFHSLLQAAGQEISQINTIVEVALDSWHVEVGDELTMQIFFHGETDHVEFYAELVKPVRERELGVLQTLLCLQYLQESVPRPRIAMDKPDGNLLCLLHVQEADLEMDKFITILEYFCTYIINLCDFIRDYPQQNLSPISTTHLALQV
jgi:hypothetical protein